jgi:hypothetical protein
MQRMHVSPWFVDGASSSDEGLARDLTAEDAHSVFIGALPSKDVDLNGLKVQQVDEIVECPLTVCRRRCIRIGRCGGESHARAMLPRFSSISVADNR